MATAPTRRSTAAPASHAVRPSGPRILCLAHAMKETLDVRLVQKALELGVQLGGGRLVGSYCVSDGGDGFLEALASLRGSQRLRMVAPGPLGRLVMSEMLYTMDRQEAGIETALACGLALVPPGRRDIMRSGTRGVAELLINGIRLGAKRLVLGLGGSATCDGGLGLLIRLEEAFLDRPLGSHLGAADLERDWTLDLKGLRQRLTGIEIVVCCDVDNPLAGPTGAARVFAPQKGATPQQVEELDRLLGSWGGKLEAACGESIAERPGAGAAGGLGAALAALGGRLVSGSEYLAEAIGLEQCLATCDLMITTEGRFDESSLHGKAPWFLAEKAAAAGNVDAVLLCGSATPDAREKAQQQGVRVLEAGSTTGDAPPPRSAAFQALQDACTRAVRSRR